MTYTLPPYQPVVAVDANTLDERHWRRVSVGEVVHTHWQAYLLISGPGGGWQLTSFWTKDGQRVTGRTVYRAPASLSAWLSLAAPLVRKWWARLTGQAPSP